MQNNMLKEWTEALLDTGNKNNLINYRDTQLSTLDAISPCTEDLFEFINKANSEIILDVYMPDRDEVLIEDDATGVKTVIPRDDYKNMFEGAIGNKKILLYNSHKYINNVLSKIKKSVQDNINETGVNTLYMAFGFVEWLEEDNSTKHKAPLLLIPISIIRDGKSKQYQIKVWGEEFIVNPTFNLKLKNAYGSMLPEYKPDESYASYTQRVKEYINDLKWKVVDMCRIGMFSFQKINMYHDLKDNAQKIQESENIKVLMGTKSQLESYGDMIFSQDKKYPVSQLKNVVDADSSQSKAIMMAKNGKSFVLQGPPGTGKSQTITNIISQALYDGKKVLFVSEKLAALEVVHSKLKHAGLDEFCLELHSHKANSKDFVNSIYKALTTRRGVEQRGIDNELKEREFYQQQLDEYVKELHKNNEVIDKSLYEIIDSQSEYADADKIDFCIKNIESKGKDYILNATEKLESYCNYANSGIGYDYHNNIWYGYDGKILEYEQLIHFKQALEELAEQMQTLYAHLQENQYEWQSDELSISDLYLLRDVFDIFGHSDILSNKILQLTDYAEFSEQLKQMRVLSEEIKCHKQELEKAFDKEIYDLEGYSTYKNLTNRYGNVIGRLLSNDYKQLRQKLVECAKPQQKVTYASALKSMQELWDYQRKTKLLQELYEKASAFFGSGYEGAYTNWEKAIENINRISKNTYNQKVLDILESGISQSEMLNIYDNLSRVLPQRELFERIRHTFNIDLYDIAGVCVEDACSKIISCSEDELKTFSHWCDFILLLSELQKLDCKEFVDFAISKNIAIDNYIKDFNYLFYLQWGDHIILKSEMLRKFNRVTHDSNVDKFIRKDNLLTEINKSLIIAQLYNNRPYLGEGAQIVPDSEVGKLVQYSKSTKGKSKKNIRQLMSELRQLILTLKPCFLMSPLSVSTYLPTDTQFDLVIFDEASQVFPHDAIGALYRAKQAIIVGDSKQMPPSNFFNVSQDNQIEDDEVHASDYKSILDLCSTKMPQLMLGWHYRSKYEQLIAFSNREFYNSNLLTFPTANYSDEDIGITHEYVEKGVYEQNSRTNQKEAERVIELIHRHILKHPDRSLGIIAFNIAQQELIESKLTRQLYRDSEFEQAFQEFEHNHKNEPFFIKNLESVQGDERDSIIFSIAYGKNTDGKLLQNFGPLNKEGGERRLNVAITRAKINNCVVTSMNSYEIDTTNTQSLGTKLLKKYLEFAEKKTLIQKEEPHSVGYSIDKYNFESQVCEFLRNNGYYADTAIGYSKFKVDIGVKIPRTDKYVLAVELDGNTYRDTEDARDRDRLRQQVLEKMGWKYHRIWSANWFRNNKEEKEALLRACNEALGEDYEGAKHKDNSSGSEQEPITLNDVEHIDISWDDTQEMLKESANDDNAGESLEYAQTQQPLSVDLFDSEDAQDDQLDLGSLFLEEVSVSEPTNFESYTMYDESLITKNSKLGEIIKGMADVEAPIHTEYILERLLKKFNMIEASPKVIAAYNRELQKLGEDYELRGDFLYKKSNKIQFRLPSKEGAGREIQHICSEELADGLIRMIQQNVSVEKTQLYNSICDMLGYAELTEQISKQLDNAMILIIDKIKIKGNTFSIK